MRIKILLSAMLALSVGMFAACKQDDPVKPYVPGQKDKVGVFDYAVLGATQHPRLLMNESDFETLKDKVENKASLYPELVKAHNLALSLADASLNDNTPITHTLEGIRMLAQSRLALQRLSSCAYAWKLTGRKDYLEKVKSDLETVLSFEDWNISKHALDAFEMALGVALAYDWCYSDLDEAMKLKVHKVFVSHIFNVYQNDSFRTATNNHNQVCYAGLVAAAIVLYEKDKNICYSAIEDAIKMNKPCQVLEYSPDGLYPEGYGYWNYGTTFETIMIAALYKIFGNAGGLDVQGFKESGEWINFMTGAVDEPFNYADCNSSEFSVAYPLWWMAAHYGQPSLLFDELRKLNSGKFIKERLSVLLPCWMNNSGFGLSDLRAPDKTVWSGEGENAVVLIRNGWTFGPTDTYLGIKAGTANVSHGHMDAGSFVYDAGGVRWSSDLGPESYTKGEAAYKDFWNYAQTSNRWKIFRLNNYSHSTLTVNDALHVSKGVATISNVSVVTDDQGATVDLSPVLSNQLESASRTFRLKGNVLEITDILKASNGFPAEVQWRMMTSAGVTPGSTSETLTKYGKTLILRAESSSSAISPEYTKWAASGTDSVDSANPGMTIAGYVFTIPAGASVTMTTKLILQ